MEVGVTAEEIAKRYPRLYHMAFEGSWPSIKRHGLLSTSALLDLYGVQGDARERIESRHRPESVRIEHPKYGAAYIRDQKPMSDRGLQRALLDGLTPSDWYRLLNRRVFFWVSEDRLRTMMNARAYRGLRKTILTVDTAPLLKRHARRVELAPINSGATKPFPRSRGSQTFLPLDRYPYQSWLNKRKGRDVVVELAVEHGVLDITEFVIRVEEVGGGSPGVELFKSGI